MSAVWILVTWIAGTGISSVPVAFPTKEACEREAARFITAAMVIDMPGAICLKRDGDR